MKRVVGYWGTWSAYNKGNGKFEVTDIDPTLCTHLIYSFFEVNADGSVKHSDPYLNLPDNYGKDFISKFIELRAKSPSTKFMFAIGGWNAGSKVFSDLVASKKSRTIFTKSVLDTCLKHDFDGVDLDWLYPAQRGGNASKDKANLVALLKELKNTLSSNGKILSIAVGAFESSAVQSYDIPNIAANVDFINLMSYDLHGFWDTVTGINSPLYPGPKDLTPHQKQLNVNAIVKYWLSQKCPRDKLVVGISLYGRSFTLTNPTDKHVYAPCKGPGKVGSCSNEAGTLSYHEIAMNIKNEGWERFWDEKQKCPYAVAGDQWVSYDDEDSIKEKFNYIKENNLGGAMFWSIDHDDFNNFCGDGKYPLLKFARGYE